MAELKAAPILTLADVKRELKDCFGSRLKVGGQVIYIGKGMESTSRPSNWLHRVEEIIVTRAETKKVYSNCNHHSSEGYAYNVIVKISDSCGYITRVKMPMEKLIVMDKIVTKSHNEYIEV